MNTVQRNGVLPQSVLNGYTPPDYSFAQSAYNGLYGIFNSADPKYSSAMSSNDIAKELASQQSTLKNVYATGDMNAIAEAQNNIDYLTNLQADRKAVANMLGKDVNSLTNQEFMAGQQQLQATKPQSGMSDFVNNTLGGWGNVFSGIQSLGNLYGGYKQMGLMQDQLDLARDSFNYNKALTSKNLANQVQSYNTSLADRYRARAFTETGNANAYDKQIEERKLDSKI